MLSLDYLKYEQTGEIRFALPSGITRPTEIERERTKRPSPGTLRVIKYTVELKRTYVLQISRYLKMGRCLENLAL